MARRKKTTIKKVVAKFQPRYRLEISQEQAGLIAPAAELYFRLGGGHFTLLEGFFWNGEGTLEKARPHLEALQIIKTGALNIFPGVHKLDDDFWILCDIHQVVRNRLALDRQAKGDKTWSVALDDPFQQSDKQPLAKIAHITKKMDRRKKVAYKFRPRYNLEISEHQAKLIADAVEFNIRMRAGQFEMLDIFFWDDDEALKKARPHLKDLRIIKEHYLTAHPEVEQLDLDEDYRILFDMYRVVRYRLACDRDPERKGSYSVDFDEPFQRSKKQPLAKIGDVTQHRDMVALSK